MESKDYSRIRKANIIFIDMRAFRFYIEKEEKEHIYCIHDNNVDIFSDCKARFDYSSGAKHLPDFVYAFAFTDFPLKDMEKWLDLCIEIEEIKHIESSWEKWSEDELNILKKYYPTEGSNVFLRIEGRTKSACKVKAVKMGLLTEEQAKYMIY